VKELNVRLVNRKTLTEMAKGKIVEAESLGVPHHYFRRGDLVLREGAALAQLEQCYVEFEDGLQRDVYMVHPRVRPAGEVPSWYVDLK
jgi:hypothetical protein